MEIDLKLTHEMLNLVSEIDAFNGSWKALGRLKPDSLAKLKKIATIESVASSTRIEGVTLTDRQVAKLLSNLETTSFESRDEQEVAGYARCMEVIFDSFDAMKLDENHIKQMHSLLLSFSSKDVRHQGEYKKLENSVNAYDAQGQVVGVVFKTATAVETPNKMQNLLKWTNDNLDADEIHPLLVIATFIIHFLAIHPFQDGNGRLSRIITTFCLMNCGYEYVIYSSMERIIEMEKKQYYMALRKSQQGIFDNKADLSHWLTFFLKALKKQKDHLLQKVERENLLNALPPLSTQILDLVEQEGNLKIADLVELTRANRSTIKDHLKELVKSGHLKQSGLGKGTSYSIP